MSSGYSFRGSYQHRVVDDELDDLFAQLPAILLDGPKGVGKTESATRRCQTVRRLDVEAERDVVLADPSVIALDPTPVLIDEWQRVPTVFEEIRRLVDADPTGGRYLLAGSPPMRGTHSGAGRITTMRMRPLTLPERGVETPSVSLRQLLDGSANVAGRTELTLADYTTEMLASGFPAMRDLDGRALTGQLDSYLDRIVDHDLPEIAERSVRRPEAVRAWLRAYAAAVGTPSTWETIRDAATPGHANKPSRDSTSTYIELLTMLRILDPVEAWIPTTNHLRALTGHPKHYLVDPALAARLVRRSATQLLAGSAPNTLVPRDGGFLGGLFENFAALTVRTFAQASDASVYHLRTQGGRHEVDFIVESDAGVTGIEVKLSGSVGSSDVKHLTWLRDEIGDECVSLVVLNIGPEAYTRADGVVVVPLALLGP